MRHPENIETYTKTSKSLTNYFSSPMSNILKKVTGDKLQFSITNGFADKSIRVALATANIPVEGVSAEEKNSVMVYAIHNHNTAALAREGHAVDTVLDDMNVALTIDGTSATVAMGTVDSSKSIQHAKRSLALNPRWIKQITIAANSTRAYETSMVVATLSPFRQTPEEVIDLNQFYKVEQYQNDKIEIPFAEGQLQWNDSLFMALNIPADVREQITIEFYD